MSDWKLVRQSIGDEAADILVRQFGGLKIYIPSKDGRDQKHKSILKDLMLGRSIREVARKYEYSEEWIRQILMKHREKNSKTRI